MSPIDQDSFGCGKGYFSKAINLTVTEFSAALPIPATTKVKKIVEPEDESTKKENSEKNKSTNNIQKWCNLHCEVSLPQKTVCSKNKSEEAKDVTLTLWLFVSIKICSTFATGLTYTLFEVATIAVLKHYGNDYGLQRLYGSIGGMVFAPLAGFFVDSIGEGGSYKDY